VIRTLVILAVVSFVLSIGCLAAAFAIAGGPFTIDDDWRFHHGTWDIDISADDFNTGGLQSFAPGPKWMPAVDLG
jgi:hypothetical protein